MHPFLKKGEGRRKWLAHKLAPPCSPPRATRARRHGGANATHRVHNLSDTTRRDVLARYALGAKEAPMPREETLGRVACDAYASARRAVDA